MDSTTMAGILDYLCDELGGDWLLTGGALVRLIFDASRGTEDIDLVRIRHASQSDEATKTALFRWLIDRGLGPEWVNSAVEPFVREVVGWQEQLVLIRQGRLGALYRPNLTFFAYLKLRRGTQIDLEDIRKAVPECSEGFVETEFLAWSSPQVLARFRQHRQFLGL